ncbi:hypothetical protein SBD_3447 [Streptomyces bottropensis ATCC 25435]|uniref:Uncharacterized protein n=1 Tax=Streptomyces bottropensis ATCC 25435 TaxID=1054862 RepID=M3F3J1_9ACTN|nr:hypothetical protein SBD_3447 [Streptomyces bottropensis ATCC 25435]
MGTSVRLPSDPRSTLVRAGNESRQPGAGWAAIKIGPVNRRRKYSRAFESRLLLEVYLSFLGLVSGFIGQHPVVPRRNARVTLGPCASTSALITPDTNSRTTSWSG